MLSQLDRLKIDDFNRFVYSLLASWSLEGDGRLDSTLCCPARITTQIAKCLVGHEQSSLRLRLVVRISLQGYFHGLPQFLEYVKLCHN